MAYCYHFTGTLVPAIAVILKLQPFQFDGCGCKMCVVETRTPLGIGRNSEALSNSRLDKG